MFYNILGKFLKLLLIYLGPLYIKLGQILCYQFPILKELFVLQNKCPSLSKKEIGYFQNKYPHLSIYDNPIATGSIAVVHKGLLNGKLVAVKIKRPNIDTIIKNSLWYTHIIKDILCWIPFLNVLNLQEKIELILQLYQNGTDFGEEYNNWELLIKNTKNAVNITIPHFYKNYCNEELLVQEYLPGDNIVSNTILGDELVILGDLLIGFYISGIINGFIHADLHPGNFAWDNNSIIIYDFGLMLKITKKETLQIIELLGYLLNNDLHNVGECFIKYFIDVNMKYSNYQKTLNYYKNSTAFYNTLNNNYKNLDFLELFFLVKNNFVRHNLKFNNKMIYIEISLLSFNTTLSYISDKVNIDKKVLFTKFIDTFYNSILEDY